MVFDSNVVFPDKIFPNSTARPSSKSNYEDNQCRPKSPCRSSLPEDESAEFFKVKEETWLVLREEGMVVEEVNDDDATDDSENEKFDEKEAMGADNHIRPQEHWRTEDVDVR